VIDVKFQRILLASHDTEGARAAERAAMALCALDGAIHHLVVVPDFWKGMMGDDWLNNASTRDRYARYLESELGREIQEHVDRLRGEVEACGISYAYQIMLGKPEQCLLEACGETRFDVAVIGSPRPKGKRGFRSRMAVEPLAKALEIPLLMVPFPRDA